jgi:hypothetical protein
MLVHLVKPPENQSFVLFRHRYTPHARGNIQIGYATKKLGNLGYWKKST